LAIFVAAVGSPNGWKWDKGKARADDGGSTPTGWSWNSLPQGWSWNEGEVVSTGNQVTVAGDTSSVAVAPPSGVDPEVGDAVAVIDTGDDTLLGFPKNNGEVKWTALGWSWND
jgi:hypothetical protein